MVERSQILLDLFFLVYLALFFCVVWKLIDFTSDWHHDRLAAKIGQDITLGIRRFSE